MPPSSDPVIEVIDDLVPADLHAAAWSACSAKRWYFGNSSNPRDAVPFWKMDLDGDPAFAAIWDRVRPRCEGLAGAPIRVLRVYANGHTYGLGGKPHLDDPRPGSFTLLYYPNPEWQDGWDGETVFFDQAGEVALAVRLRPNRAVFFDSRILHSGRAPSRLCPILRVTVAYKLEIVSAEPTPAAPTEAHQAEGPQRVHKLRVPADTVQPAVDEHLAQLSQSLRLPGFRPGHIPREVLLERYGAQARATVFNRLIGEAIDRDLPRGSVPSTVNVTGGADGNGDLEFDVSAVFLPALPPLDLSTLTVERVTAAESDLRELGIDPSDAALRLRTYEKAQLLDYLDAFYRFPIREALIDRELAAIQKAAEAEIGAPGDPTLFRPIAERRVRLGLVLSELARRYEIRAPHAPALEEVVLDYLLARARIVESQATLDELRELLKA